MTKVAADLEPQLPFRDRVKYQIRLACYYMEEIMSWVNLFLTTSSDLS
jgi:hypothetical protein